MGDRGGGARDPVEAPVEEGITDQPQSLVEGGRGLRPELLVGGVEGRGSCGRGVLGPRSPRPPARRGT